MHLRINPTNIAAPNNNAYSHAVLIAAGTRVLHISGQIGTRVDGTIPADFEEQAAIVWSNLRVILKAADMDVSHLIKINSFIVGTAHLPAFVASRLAFLGDGRCDARPRDERAETRGTTTSRRTRDAVSQRNLHRTSPPSASVGFLFRTTRATFSC